ncbi:MAG: ATP-binding protein [Chloroflexota bacterium]
MFISHPFALSFILLLIGLIVGASMYHYASRHARRSPSSQPEDNHRNELAAEHKRTQSLLRIITTISSTLDLDQILDRTLNVLNEVIGSEQSSILLKRPEQPMLYYRASLGYAAPPPPGGRPTTIKANEGLGGWVIAHRQPVLIPDLNQDPRWITSNGYSLQHRSSIAVPLILGEECLGALLLFHTRQNFFLTHQLDFVQAAANQIAVAINNADLYNLIRLQADRLSVMLRTQQVEASQSRAILESIADGVLVTDSKGNITLINDSAERILGLNQSEVIGKPLSNYADMLGKAARSWWASIQNWSLAPPTSQEGKALAEQITLEDGRFISVHLAPVTLQNEFLGTVSVFRDITHQVEVDRLKSEFVANVSHELRTPMTSIKGYVELLLMGAAGTFNHQQLDFLKKVRDNTERLNVLVHDLLDLSRIDAGQIRLEVTLLDIRAIAEDVVMEFRRRTQKEKRQMTFEVLAPPELPPLPGDEARVHQILTNLIENAYRYTSGSGKVIVRLIPKKDQIQIEVQDEGVGIPPEEQPCIFDRFFRGHHPLVTASAGTGLGLSIVKHLVELHNGSIWVESNGVPGRGSTFSFTLPTRTPDNDKGSDNSSRSATAS